MKPVESEAIKAVGYNAADRTLHVEFGNGRKYRYSDVSPQKHAALMAAESKGKHFMQHIRHSHQYEQY
jgi:hypothetical protein